MTDYGKLGLKAGIEVHNQLDTREKLFCPCTTRMLGEHPIASLVRKQHPVASELGEYDVAAQYEVGRDRIFVYDVFRGETCQVEMDEEPPHRLNEEALEAALTVALLFNCRIPDEIHVMRKTVIDGSNTTSFQRTMVVGMGGHMDYKGRRVPIDQVSLEEDAASIGGEEGGAVRYRLNRLGVPLIEVATGLLENYTPEELQEVALGIGMTVRSTGKAKKSIGAIRQDLNISVAGGARNELKGIQELGMLSKAAENEVSRQLSMMSLRGELSRRGLKKIHDDPVAVNSVLSGTQNKIIKSAVENGGNIYAVVLPKFSGLLKTELFPGKTLGRELADVAVAFGLRGIIHTDEDLSKYKLENEFELLRSHLKAGRDDAIVIVADDKTMGRAAKEVLERARGMLRGVQEGTRSVTADGSSKFNRPLPGSKRMYPETDIEPVPITPQLLRALRSNLPELIPQRTERMKRQYRLSDSLAREIMRSSRLDMFEEAVSKSGLEPTVIANALTSVLKDLERRGGLDTSQIPDATFFEIFQRVKNGGLAKEAIQNVLLHLAKNPGKGLEAAVREMGLETMSESEIRGVVDEVMAGSEMPEGKLVGLVMSRVRGKADPQTVIRVVRKMSKK